LFNPLLFLELFYLVIGMKVDFILKLINKLLIAGFLQITNQFTT